MKLIYIIHIYLNDKCSNLAIITITGYLHIYVLYSSLILICSSELIGDFHKFSISSIFSKAMAQHASYSFSFLFLFLLILSSWKMNLWGGNTFLLRYCDVQLGSGHLNFRKNLLSVSDGTKILRL